MRIDTIDTLVGEAHEIFNATSVFEVIDLNKPDAVEVLNKTYHNPRIEKIERYLDVVKKLKWVTG